MRADDETWAEVAHLEAQHPQQEIARWYPATMTTGREVEIRRTFGKGRSRGVLLTVRWKVPRMLRMEGSIMPPRVAGTAYRIIRFNLGTCEMREIE